MPTQRNIVQGIRALVDLTPANWRCPRPHTEDGRTYVAELYRQAGYYIETMRELNVGVEGITATVVLTEDVTIEVLQERRSLFVEWLRKKIDDDLAELFDGEPVSDLEGIRRRKDGKPGF